MTETIQVTYSPEDMVFKEVNPLGEPPDHLHYKHQKFKGEWTFISDDHMNRYGDDFDKWQQAEQSRRSFPLPNEAEELAKEHAIHKIWYKRYPKNAESDILNSFNDGFHAAKEKSPFSKEQMIGFAEWKDKQRCGLSYEHPAHDWCIGFPNEKSNAQLLDLYLQSLSPFKEGVVYSAEIVDEKRSLIKIVKQ